MDAPSQITVHALQAQVSESLESSAFQEDALLLDRGRALVQDAFGGSGWHTPSPKFAPTVFDRHSGRTYVFAHAPPRIEVEGPPLMPHLKEWGAPVSPSDVFTLKELLPFKPNLPDKPLQTPAVLPLHPRSPSRRPFSPQSTDTEPPLKRLKLDTGPLHSVIPEPHYHAAPYRPPNATLTLAEPYKRTTPTPLAPHTPDGICSLLASPHRRVAWIIPVRGILPWDCVTPARITDDMDALPHGCDSSSENNDILWTHASLRDFWTFMLRALRAAQLGPVSLSFHTANASGTGFSQAGASSPYVSHGANRGVSVSHYPGSMSGEESTSAPPLVPRRRLMDVDHIKIFCDAPRAMILRNLIDAWKYEIEDSESKTDAGEGNTKKTKMKKIRVLRRAKLVLVDGKSAGVLVL